LAFAGLDHPAIACAFEFHNSQKIILFKIHLLLVDGIVQEQLKKEWIIKINPQSSVLSVKSVVDFPCDELLLHNKLKSLFVPSITLKYSYDHNNHHNKGMSYLRLCLS
jgi:hypothetical protein